MVDLTPRWKVPLADLDFDEAEERAVLEVLRSKWLTMGAVTQQFEAEFADFLGVKHAIAVSNCTAALHLALLALEIGPGDNVIVPSLTFVATANAVLYTGAEVRFADVHSLDNLTIDPRSVYTQIDANTRAVMVMHYGGFPCDMPTILELAHEHNLAVIEDAAHAPGARLNGSCLGTLGDIGCFSFFSNKNLATGEGGMVVTNRDDLAEKIRLLRSHGMTSLTWDRHQGHAHSYDVIALGYNDRIDEVHASIGIQQLRKLPKNNSRRRAITQTYWSAFEEFNQDSSVQLSLPFLKHSERRAGAQEGIPDDVEPAYHIFPVILPETIDRSLFINLLKDAGIQTSIHYPPVHGFRYYQSLFSSSGQEAPSLPITEQAAAREVTLPLYPGMSDEQLRFVIAAVEKALKDCSL